MIVTEVSSCVAVAAPPAILSTASTAIWGCNRGESNAIDNGTGTPALMSAMRWARNCGGGAATTATLSVAGFVRVPGMETEILPWLPPAADPSA